MKLETIKNIEIKENINDLTVLINNEQGEIAFETLMLFKNYKKVVIAVDSTLLLSKLNAVIQLRNYEVVLLSRLPIYQYDILMSPRIDNVVMSLVNNIKIKYLLFLTNVGNYQINNYYKFDDDAYKLIDKTNVINKTDPENIVSEDQVKEKIKNTEDSSQQYKNLINSLELDERVYNKYSINYLHEEVAGMVSIIMIVSEANNKFAETLRTLRTQNVPLVEYIIIDNAAGFRNNVKPNIRYGEKMPDDFCTYHAKELCSGEYMIILNQDSDEFNILDYVSKGKYEKR